ncbi:MAG: hypothetical protein KJO67_07035 [Silicimonas sp.]|nr:hypothetical protein [Silicimonas sp.]
MIDRMFLSHPTSVDESYLQHARFAATFSLRLFAAAGAAAIHALVPCFFEKTASGIIADLYEKSRHRR